MATRPSSRHARRPGRLDAGQRWGDGTGDACDDSDGDGIDNGDDSDVDGDGIDNGDDSDVDGDGIDNGDDPDVDGDGIDNGDDPDVDGDGLANGDDPDVDGDGIDNGDDPDVDGDGIDNGEDDDIDGDGVINAEDDDMNGDGETNDQDSDDDGDGIDDDDDPAPCGAGPPAERCCLPDGTCRDVDPACCTNVLGGLPMGGLCAAAQKCCLPDGSCVVTDPSCCILAGGVPAGPGPCQPLHKCCLPGGSCVNAEPSCCINLLGGTPTPGACGPPEACCFPDGSCQQLEPDCCVAAGGTPAGAGPCDVPEACCLPSGACSTLAPACCYVLGGTPAGPGSCQGTQACCLAGGTCVMVAPACCALVGGMSQGPGTACSLVVCCTIDLDIAGVPDADEWNLGGFLCVNDDDDNANGVADKDESGATTGENDLLQLAMDATGLDPAGTVTLSVTAGAASIRVYENADRSGPVTLPAMWPSNMVPAFVYVEGAAHSLAARDVELKLAYAGPDGSCEDIVKMTVIEVQQVEWVAMDSPLDPNPNPPHPGGGKRMFPGKATPTDTIDRSKVKVRATLAPAVPGVEVFFKSFDVDDPSANTPPIDAEANPADNRGTLNQPVPTSIVTNAQGQAEVELEVSMQPGDNFKVVASCLADYFDNLQARQNDSPLARVEHPQGWFVPANHITELLTVWRRLHVEVDSMGAVTGNEINAPFTDIVGSGTALTEVTGLGAAGVPSLDDGSTDLDDAPPANGRFENGTLIVGTAPNTITISPVTGNGNNRLVFPAASIAGLPFSAIDSDAFGNGIISGTITNVITAGSNFIWTLNITAHNETPIDWPAFTGGMFSVGGGAEVMILVASGGLTTGALTTDALNIPCVVRDDDNLMNGQDVPTPDTSGIADMYAAAYIAPALDTGANTTNSPLHLTTRFGAEVNTHMNETRGAGNASNLYWVVIAKNGYQTDADLTGGGDNDPDNEGTWRAAGSSGGGTQPGAILLEESIRDWIAASVANGGAGGVDPDTTGAPNRQTRRQEILNHELGHNFGLVHADGSVVAGVDPFGGVMRASNAPRQASTFTQTSLDKIRRKTHPG